MEMTVSFGDHHAAATITVVGDLDVETASTFGRLVLGMHEMLGSEATYDFSGVVVRDDAARSTLELIAHDFREFGPCVTMPRLEVDAPASRVRTPPVGWVRGVARPHRQRTGHS